MIDDSPEEEFFEDNEGDEEDYAIEWLSDCDSFYVKKKSYSISYYDGGWYSIDDLCSFKECPSYCGGLLITDIVCPKEVFKDFVTTLKRDTPYSQLLCSDVTNEAFLFCGAIDIGGFLLLEVCNVN